MVATAGNDFIVTADPTTILPLDGLAGDDTILGTPGPDSILGNRGNDLLFGNQGNDSLLGNQGNDTLHGGQENDQLWGGDGNDLLLGERGSDTLRGENGNDTLVGGPGPDFLDGGNGNDTIIWNNGDGSDTIEGGPGTDLVEVNGAPNDGNAFLLDANGNRVALSRLNLGEFTLNINEVENFVINGGASNDSLQVGVLGSPDVASVTFNGGGGDNVLDGTASSKPLIANGGAGNDLLRGGTARDQLFGGPGNDTLIGGLEADSLNGGAGDDRIIWNNGDGSDRILGGPGNDVVEVNGDPVNADLFAISASGTQVTFNRSNLGQFRLQTGEVERFEINGSGGADSLEVSDLTSAGGGLVVFDGGQDNDTLNATRANQAVVGLGGPGDDSLMGGNGNDTLEGEDGNDTLIGKGGSDLLLGGAGNDRIIWNNGDGSDTIDGGSGEDAFEVNGSASEGDNFVLSATGSTANLARQNLGVFNLSVTNVENAVIRGQGGDDRLAVNNLSDTDIQFVRFDGDAGNDTLDSSNTETPIDSDGGDGNDLLVGGSGNDFFLGNAGDDTLVGGDGNDTLRGNAGNDSILGGNGSDVIRGDDGNDTIIGRPGSDSIAGDAGNDLIIWNNGDGSDFIEGGEGTDTVQVNGNPVNGNQFNIVSNGERVIFNRLNQGEFVLNVNDVEVFDVTGGASGDRLGIASVVGTDLQRVVFDGAGGDDTLNGLADANIPIFALGGAGNDILGGGLVNDTLEGGIGDDTLQGGAGDDSMNGGAGNDVFFWNNGDGSDILEGGEGTDRVVIAGAGDNVNEFTLSLRGNRASFSRVNLDPFTLNMGTLEEVLVGGGNQSDQFTINDVAAAGVNLVRFVSGGGNDTLFGGKATQALQALTGAGNDLVIGGAGNDSLVTEDGDDTIIGGPGNDIIQAGAGNDTIIWNNGDGSDQVNGGEGFDQQIVNGSAEGDNLSVSGNADGTVNVSRQNLVPFAITMNGVEALNINAGGGNDVINVDNITATDLSGMQVFGDADNDTLLGSNALTPLFLHGNLGDDVIVGGQASDILSGGRGNDSIVGGAGDDTIVSGLGNDTLSGGSGADLFIFSRGAGSNLVLDFEQTQDIIGLTGGLTVADVTVSQSGNAPNVAILRVTGGETLATLQGVTILDGFNFQII